MVSMKFCAIPEKDILYTLTFIWPPRSFVNKILNIGQKLTVYL